MQKCCTLFIICSSHIYNFCTGIILSVLFKLCIFLKKIIIHTNLYDKINFIYKNIFIRSN